MKELPKNIDQVIASMDDIVKDSVENGSREGYFAALYRRVTIRIKQEIDKGSFQDNLRMEKLDVIFANRYLLAYHNYKNSLPCSKSWELAFGTCKNYRPLVIQHLFAGMNAHIGLDLGIAAAQVQRDNINSLKADFDKINEILEDLVDGVQEDIAAIFPLLKPIDWLAGSADEKMAGFAMGIARDRAWQVARDLVQLNQKGQDVYIQRRDLKVASYSAKIMHPKGFLSIVMAFFRLFEFGSIRSKIKSLAKSQKHEEAEALIIS